MKELPSMMIFENRSNTLIKEVNSLFKRIMKKYYVNQTIFPTLKHNFTAVYSRDKEYLFNLDSPNFFTTATRARIVQFILDRTRFTETKDDDFAFGIDRLISEKAYIAAYPLHDVSHFFVFFIVSFIIYYANYFNFTLKLHICIHIFFRNFRIIELLYRILRYIYI